MPEITLRKITEILKGELQGDPQCRIHGVNSFVRATPGEITFRARTSVGSTTRASAVIVHRDDPLTHPNLIRVDFPYISFSRLLEIYHPPVEFSPGISDRADISSSARLGKDVQIGAFSTIGSNAAVGNHTSIHGGVHIYPGVTIGENCLIYSNVVIRENTTVGNGVIIQPGAVIGADGFGFQRDSQGRFVKVPQKGRVIIGDHCEIGANTCIDRSTIEETVLEEDVKLDNLVQIGHNVQIGPSTAISALSGISGSARIGGRVTMAGQVGVADHVHIADGTVVAGKTGVTGHVKKQAVLAGYPGKPIQNWRREQVIMRNIEKYIEKIKELEKKWNQMREKRDE